MLLPAAGFLQPQRVQKLKQLNVPWQPIRTEADILWDAKLTQLMSFRREHGHVRVSKHGHVRVTKPALQHRAFVQAYT